MKVTPRRGEPGSNVLIQKPLTGMTIRLTPELLGRLQTPGPKPGIQLVLRSMAEGGPVLVVGGVEYNTNAHKMAIGSEVHIVARVGSARGSGLDGTVNGAGGDEEGLKKASGMAVLASLHRKLIVQQVLTEAKRAEIRARNDAIERLEKDAKKTMVRMEDQDEMLAAAGSIPVPAAPRHTSAAWQEQLQESSAAAAAGGAAGAGAARNDRKRARSPSAVVGVGAGGGGGGGGEGGDGSRSEERDPLTAWVYGCYNHDDYAGHVSDLRHFLKGIDFQHVMFRYHVKPGGVLDPDRRRFCIRFKTKAGRDLAVGRSGEALGASGSWSPDSVAVVRGRNEDVVTTPTAAAAAGGGGGDGDDGGSSPNDFLLVLPQGRSVAEVLEKVTARLPEDLTPATSAAASSSGGGAPRAYRERLETYRRDMFRAALGATLAEARSLGAERGAPRACVAGTDEDNARRVATLAASEAGRALDAGMEVARGLRGGGERGGVRGRLSASGGDSGNSSSGHYLEMMSGGARAQRRSAMKRFA